MTGIASLRSATGVSFLSGLIRSAPALILALALVGGAHGSQCVTNGASRTFVQLWRIDAQRNAAQWDHWFETLDSLGFTEIIVQWSSYGPVSFYDDPRPGRESAPCLAPFIKAACRHHKNIWLGLHYDPDFWQAIRKDEAGPESYLRDRLAEMEQRLPFLLRCLEKADPKGEIVKGWYVSDEIDDQNWQDPAYRKTLRHYLKSLRRKLQRAKAPWPVLISGFSNGAMPPAQLTAFWNDLLVQTRIDGFLFQDGIGAGKLTLQELKTYLQSFSKALVHIGHTFGVIVELFRIDANAAPSARLQAASIVRVTAQLDLARASSALPITVFSAPDYLMSHRDKSSLKLNRAWQKDIMTCE